MPETKDNDFTWKDFQARNNNELVAVLGNFVNRALVLTNKYFDGKVPAIGQLSDFDKSTMAEIPKIKEAIEYNLENFRFREALKAFMDLARLGNKYLADTEPWKLIKTDKERTGTILNISLQITANLAILSEPFLPFTAEKTAGFLNLKNRSWKDGGRVDLLETGHLLNEPSLLFSKVEDEAIEKQLQKLETSKAKNLADKSTVKEQKENISYDDFSKMDIRVGKILEAVKVPKTKKLMQLKIDTGIDIRTVVSGISEYFEPEAIIGKQICILANLEPREIKGIKSQGMILLAEDAGGKLVFVTPEAMVGNGSEVK
jgi:methionyl-tRNA synthetase